MLVNVTGYHIGDWLLLLNSMTDPRGKLQVCLNLQQLDAEPQESGRKQTAASISFSLLNPSASPSPPKGSVCQGVSKSNWFFCLSGLFCLVGSKLFPTPPCRISTCLEYIFTAISTALRQSFRLPSYSFSAARGSGVRERARLKFLRYTDRKSPVLQWAWLRISWRI